MAFSKPDWQTNSCSEKAAGYEKIPAAWRLLTTYIEGLDV